MFFTFKETPQEATEKPKETFISHLKDITKIDKSLLIFLISLTLITIGATNLSKYVDVYFDELGYTPQDLGTFVFVTGIVSVFASLFIVPIFTRFKNQIKTIAVIQLFSAAIVLYVFRASNFLLVIYTVYMIYIVFKAVYLPLEQNYISSHATEGKYGKVIGIRQAFLAIGMVLGPLIGGFIYERSALLLFDTSAYIFILGVLLLGLVRYFDKKKKTESILNDSQSEQ
ncbi:MAG: MFS transporter [Acholeplasmataceae bacterium]|nr:MFS transporter [Acholeplasmataceae bacterium]